MNRILVIDDDKDILTAISLLLKNESTEVITERRPDNIILRLKEKPIDLTLLDMNFRASLNTGNEGIYWLKRIHEIAPSVPVIMITAYGDIDLAIRSLKEGASDFIMKPWSNQKLIDTVNSVMNTKKRGNIKKDSDIGNDIVGESSAMKDLLGKVGKIAPTDANILILGENGTGKDLIAGLIHQRSLRNKGPFVKVDVGSLTESIFESELFGYRKGAFTDAKEDRAGRITMANKGTLFLDEIGNISLQQQSKLLSVLQNRQVTPLGSNIPVEVDIRLICATNRPRKELSNENRFRKDLIYRINTIELEVMPLRERKEDIPLLTRHFLDIYGEKYFKKADAGEDVFKKLLNYHFPGNIRELKYIIERAVIMSDHDVLIENDIVFSPVEQENKEDNESETNLGMLEKQTILRVIEKNNGNLSKAAKELGLTRTSLYRRLGKYEI